MSKPKSKTRLTQTLIIRRAPSRARTFSDIKSGEFVSVSARFKVSLRKLSSIQTSKQQDLSPRIILPLQVVRRRQSA